MASAQAAAAAEEQRQAVAGLTTLAAAELASVTASVADQPVGVVVDALMEALPALGETYGDAASVLAADYFDEQRAIAEVRGRFEATPSRGVDRARWEALARWGVDPLRAEEPNIETAHTLIEGGMTRTIADRHRLTIVESAMQDPQARGWVRIARPGACGFCLALADRGGVYTETSVEFKSHDHCLCSCAPSWDRGARKVTGVPFESSSRKSGWSRERKSRENAAMRDYIKEHYPSS